jgi:Cu-Zn family superoxide dismutase
MKGVLAGAAVLGLAGCAAAGTIADTQTVTVRDVAGRTVGTALLTPATDGVQVVLSANGLPAGVHGFHIHMNGVCDPSPPPDSAGRVEPFRTAGGHFNPTSRQHGFDNPAGHHLGDLRNVEVRADGRGSGTSVARGVTLTGGQPNSLRKSGGTSLIVHANPDDYRTDPSGNSGARIACGVIPAAD